jgi:hypothetical protein
MFPNTPQYNPMIGPCRSSLTVSEFNGIYGVHWDGGEKFHNMRKWIKFLLKGLNKSIPNDWVGEIWYANDEFPDQKGKYLVFDG